MLALMIDLTDYHVSATLGYIDTYVRYTNPLGGTSSDGPIQVPLSEVQAEVDALNAAVAARVQALLLARPKADQTLTVSVFDAKADIAENAIAEPAP